MTSGFDVLNTITKGGSDFADWYTAMRVAEVNRAAQAAQVQKAEKHALNPVENPAGITNKQTFNMFRRAIAQQESGGDYGATGIWIDGDRAYGKYQIMGNNVGNWTKEVLGTAMTPQQFLQNHKAQEQVARAKLWQAYRTYGSPRQAAMSWYGGAGAIENPYPEVKQYGHDIMDRMRAMGYSANPHAQAAGIGDVVLPSNGDMTSSYGWRVNPITGERSFHTGTDFAAAQGTPVRAMSDGRIISMEWDPVYGWQTVIKSGKHIQTMYGHMNKFNPKLEEGMRIDAGQKIGRVGSTGWSTGPHLHFEVERNGENVNPVKYLRHHDAEAWNGQPIRPSSSGGNNQPRNSTPQRPPKTKPSSLNDTLYGYGLM